MRLLAIDASTGAAVAGVVDDDTIVDEAGTGEVRALASMIAGLPLDGIQGIAVTVGPGSFTGLRSALALAHGFSRARALPLVAVTVPEALGEALPSRGGRSLWVALDSRRERLFLDRGQGAEAVLLASIAAPQTPIILAGNAARPVAALMAARGANVLLTNVTHPRAKNIARAAERRLRGEWASLAPIPLYVDPPAVRLP